MNCMMFSNLKTISIHEIWQIWEIKSRISFFIQPGFSCFWIFSRVILLVIKIDSLICQLHSNRLSKASNVPISQSWFCQSFNSRNSLCMTLRLCCTSSFKLSNSCSKLSNSTFHTLDSLLLLWYLWLEILYFLFIISRILIEWRWRWIKLWLNWNISSQFFLQSGLSFGWTVWNWSFSWIKFLQNWRFIYSAWIFIKAHSELAWLCWWIKIWLEHSTSSWHLEWNILSCSLCQSNSSIKLIIHEIYSPLWHKCHTKMWFFGCELINQLQSRVTFHIEEHLCWICSLICNINRIYRVIIINLACMFFIIKFFQSKRLWEISQIKNCILSLTKIIASHC